MSGPRNVPGPRPCDTIHPTVPGLVNGIISRDPRQIQCQECGCIEDWETTGGRPDRRVNPAMVHILSSLHFHTRTWTSGHADNPRLCRDCRLARGCTCGNCADERHQRMRFQSRRDHGRGV